LKNNRSASANRLASDAAYDYAYDAEGNLTQRVRRIDGRKWDYTWDHRNRLTAVDERLSSGTLVKRVEYAYDALDRRVFKQVDDNGNGVFDRSEHFVYDGEHIVLRYQNGQLANRYVHNPDAIDQVFADENVASLAAPDETHWMATDNQHSVRRIYDYNEATGATVEIDHVLYWMFGDVQNFSMMNTTSPKGTLFELPPSAHNRPGPECVRRSALTTGVRASWESPFARRRFTTSIAPRWTNRSDGRRN
jgi:YD repeat-containing protein